MIFLVIGTKAQLIKMAPIMVSLRQRGLPYRYISTGQHRETMADILDNFGLPGPDVILYEGRDITGIAQMGRWALGILKQVLTQRGKIFGEARRGLVLVHGDTFSTLLGALMGRVAGLRVGHVESGLRSFKLFNPFPEELIRLLTFRLSHSYFCPNPWAANNLRHYRGEKLDTGGNTLIDALVLARSRPVPPGLDIPDGPFGVVTLHRFENIFSAKALARVVERVEAIATHTPLLFILHQPTEIKLRAFGYFQRLADNPRITLRPRYDYFTFVKLLEAASFVVSDGGSNQEECAYLGKPILLLRRATERTEGLGENCVLSNYEPRIIEDFLAHLADYRVQRPLPALSPAEIIANYCQDFARDSG